MILTEDYKNLINIIFINYYSLTSMVLLHYYIYVWLPKRNYTNTTNIQDIWR